MADRAGDLARLALRAERPRPGLIADPRTTDAKVRGVLDIAFQTLR